MSLNSMESVWYAVAAFDRIFEMLLFAVLLGAAILGFRAARRAFGHRGGVRHRFVHPLGVLSERDRS